MLKANRKEPMKRVMIRKRLRVILKIKRLGKNRTGHPKRGELGRLGRPEERKVSSRGERQGAGGQVPEGV